jgi:hypothetical protein
MIQYRNLDLKAFRYFEADGILNDRARGPASPNQCQCHIFAILNKVKFMQDADRDIPV